MTSDWTLPHRPLSIAHRGASAYAYDNTIEAFSKAAELGADMWEVDIRTTADGVVIAHHDATLIDGTPVADLRYDALLARTSAQNRPCPRLSDVVALAAQTGTGLYADIKDLAATLPTLEMLQNHGIARAILGAFDPACAALLANAGCAYPRSALVPIGADPFDHATGADVIHLCWEHMTAPQDTLTVDLFSRAFAKGQRIALWHEEDPARMAHLRTKPAIGICSDRPELVHPFRPPSAWPFQVVSHRGVNSIAPENTLPALECALAAGFTAELDLHETCDGEIVVFHDPTLARTTNGSGAITDHTLTDLRALDAGAWFAPFYAGTKIPTLHEVLQLAQKYQGRLYLELKTAPPAKVWAAVVAHDLADRVFFWSFNRDLINDLRALAPDAAIMARRQDYPTLAAAITDHGARLIEFTPTEDARDVAALRGSGIDSMIAYMGHDPAVFDHIAALRPDRVNLDRPFAFLKHLRQTDL